MHIYTLCKSMICILGDNKMTSCVWMCVCVCVCVCVSNGESAGKDCVARAAWNRQPIQCGKCISSAHCDHQHVIHHLKHIASCRHRERLVCWQCRQFLLVILPLQPLPIMRGKGEQALQEDNLQLGLVLSQRDGAANGGEYAVVIVNEVVAVGLLWLCLLHRPLVNCKCERQNCSYILYM